MIHRYEPSSSQYEHFLPGISFRLPPSRLTSLLLHFMVAAPVLPTALDWEVGADAQCATLRGAAASHTPNRCGEGRPVRGLSSSAVCYTHSHKLGRLDPCGAHSYGSLLSSQWLCSCSFAANLRGRLVVRSIQCSVIFRLAYALTSPSKA